MLYCVMVSAVFIGLGSMLFATISDRWLGRRTIVVLGTAYLGLLAFPFFWLTDTGNPLLVAVALSLGLFGVGICYGPLAAYFSEIFGTRVRYSGTGLAFALGGVLGGAFTPIVAQALFASTGASWSVSLYVSAMAIVSLACNLLLPKGRRDLAFDEVEGRGAERQSAGQRT